jgi:hypothetical protein
MKAKLIFAAAVLAVCLISCKSTEVDDEDYTEKALAQLIGEWQWVETRTNNPDYWETAEKTSINGVLRISEDKSWSLSRNDTLISNGIVVKLFAQIDTVCTNGETFTYMKLHDDIAQQEIQRCYAITNDSLCTYYQPCVGGAIRKIWKKKK